MHIDDMDFTPSYINELIDVHGADKVVNTMLTQVTGKLALDGGFVSLYDPSQEGQDTFRAEMFEAIKDFAKTSYGASGTSKTPDQHWVEVAVNLTAQFLIDPDNDMSFLSDILTPEAAASLLMFTVAELVAEEPEDIDKVNEWKTTPFESLNDLLG